MHVQNKKYGNVNFISRLIGDAIKTPAGNCKYIFGVILRKYKAVM